MSSNDSKADNPEKSRMDSHCAVEQKRRKRVKELLDDLKALTPSLADRTKVDQITLLTEVAAHVRALMAETSVHGKKRRLDDPVPAAIKGLHSLAAAVTSAAPASPSNQGMMMNYPGMMDPKMAGMTRHSLPMFPPMMGPGMFHPGMSPYTTGLPSFPPMHHAQQMSMPGYAPDMYTQAAAAPEQDWMEGVSFKATNAMEIVAANEYVLQSLGFTSEQDIKGTPCMDLVPAEVREYAKSHIMEVVGRKVSVVHIVTPLVAKSGARTPPFYVSIAAIPDQVTPTLTLKLKPYYGGMMPGMPGQGNGSTVPTMMV